MDTDIPLKELFRMRARDLLPLTNDAGSEVVLVANPVNVQAARRAVRPVLTTVIYVGSPAPSELVYRQVLAGRVVNQWRFDVVRLWEQPPERLLALGPGGAALVPLCAGATLAHVAAASRSIQRRSPPAGASDLLAILQMLSDGRYTARQLARVIPQGVVMGSTLLERFTKKRVAEGRTDEARYTCARLTKSLHPAVAARLVPVIEACSELARLRRWTDRAARLSDAEFASLVTGHDAARPTRRRAPRPARKATRTARP